MAPRVRLGELLVEAQIITREQLEEVLALQKRDARRLGTLLIESGIVTETQVTQVLSQQLSIPWVSLYHIDFSRQLLDMVRGELAEKYCLVPIFVRRVRGIGETLYVAMDDPTHEEAKDTVASGSGLPVRAMIAPPSDIKAAIRVYYGAGAVHPSLAEAQAEVAGQQAPAHSAEPAWQRNVPATAAKPAPPVAAKDAPPSPEPTPPASAPQAAPPQARAAPEPSPSATAAQPRRPKGARMLTLTLLDGTQVSLPSRSRAPGQPSLRQGQDGDLSSQDLIAALRALSHGADASEILGDHVRWEAMFAALLSLLLKKHLIMDAEFVEEYKKI
jgi:type IV pilus assembly protein PilB